MRMSLLNSVQIEESPLAAQPAGIFLWTTSTPQAAKMDSL